MPLRHALCGGVAEWLRQGPAKPCTRVRFPSPPPRSLASGGVYAPSGDDYDRKIVVSLQSLRDRAQDVVISMFRAADDDDHRGFGPALAAQLIGHRGQLVRDRARARAADLAAFGQLVSRFNQSTSRA